jgi:hypothetical protein
VPQRESVTNTSIASPSKTMSASARSGFFIDARP